MQPLGISKTPDELHHDFKNKDESCHVPYIDPVAMKEISHIYDIFTNCQINTLSELLDNKDIIKYLHDLRNSTIVKDNMELISDKEWNYYTRTLKFVDQYCNNIGNLNITKLKKLENSELTDKEKDTLEENKFIKNITDNKGIVEKYIYISSDLSPVVPIFSQTNIDKQFQDNPTKFYCLDPLVHGFEEDDYKSIKTGPSMLDPATTGPLSIQDVFNNKFGVNKIKSAIQKLQDINEDDGNNQANKLFCTCIQNFISYFGVDISINKLKFTENNEKYTGIEMNQTISTDKIFLNIGRYYY